MEKKVTVLHTFIQTLNNYIWNGPMLLILMATHVYFTFHLGFVQKNVWKGIRLSFTPEDKTENKLSCFTALSTTLAATLGTGNIIGISTAVALGGPGAVFWCWITGILGMSTTYAECFLSFLFREKQYDGSYTGGPMYVLDKGLHKKKTAIFYALCTVVASFGVGCVTQANAITETAYSLWNLSPSITSVCIAFVIGMVLIGGSRAIQKVCQLLVPAMAIFYVGSCILILLYHHAYLEKACMLIVTNAFNPHAFTCGIAGGGLMLAARYGIARGLFTNEAGLGSAAIAAVTSHTQSPKRQALVSMTATFWDTVVMCFITGIAIVSHILHFPDSAKNTSITGLTANAFSILPYGRLLLGLSLIAFAIATLIGWSYFGKTAMNYIFPKGSGKIYETLYLIVIFLGGITSMNLVWEIADFLNAMMIAPNLFALYALRKQILRSD